MGALEAVKSLLPGMPMGMTESPLAEDRKQVV
jgi:hypothetical protein